MGKFDEIFFMVFFHSIKFFKELGGFACTMMPFLQTLAVLVNSIILVFIALDRYIAIKRLHRSPWEPTKSFCVACCLAVWSLAAAVSSPMVKMYEYYKVFVISDDFIKKNSIESTNIEYYEGFMCGKSQVSLSQENYFPQKVKMFSLFRVRVFTTFHFYFLSFFVHLC
jgi:hypothetical protein